MSSQTAYATEAETICTQIAQLDQKLLALAHQQHWSATVSVTAERRRLLEEVFRLSEPALLRSLIDSVVRTDAEIRQLAEQAQTKAEARLTTQNMNRQAIHSYKSLANPKPP